MNVICLYRKRGRHTRLNAKGLQRHWRMKMRRSRKLLRDKKSNLGTMQEPISIALSKIWTQRILLLSETCLQIFKSTANTLALISISSISCLKYNLKCKKWLWRYRDLRRTTITSNYLCSRKTRKTAQSSTTISPLRDRRLPLKTMLPAITTPNNTMKILSKRMQSFNN